MNVVISGTSNGIGKAIAEKFLNNGYSVFGYDIDERKISHPSYTHFIHDIRNEEFVSTPDDVSILINCAGTLNEKEAIDVNLKGSITFTEHFVKEQGLKSILFIASASARNGAEFPMYVASKAGIVGYMKKTALDVSKRRITCNSISPGGVITSSNDHILKSDRLYKAVLDETLLGKWAYPEEIAELAYYLTVLNHSITGEDILIDNGEMLKSNFVW